ncbi:hypothetical protein Nepgr_022599 [Nepenthes gracilis]|uniref:Uncharacterized protein n=1 Tax=Nepenthes gracilis TaxID=150966 RepID=A0AAD3XWY8_NEPGR|nr:hypothetical protein Nepgr_022599 [Nepenthes gracilis]
MRCRQIINRSLDLVLHSRHDPGVLSESTYELTKHGKTTKENSERNDHHILLLAKSRTAFLVKFTIPFFLYFGLQFLGGLTCIIDNF